MIYSLRNATSDFVIQSDIDKSIYTAKVDISKLKSELQMVERSDFNTLKIENERLLTEIDKLKQKLNEETGTRIESEIAGLRTQMETIKSQILQYMIGTLTGVGALILAYLRMFR
ncbi:12825_t:CDS:2 [Rhizophagus irregularis]|nr:12825_t:CDS:2 [Rhizophagus irregularis]